MLKRKAKRRSTGHIPEPALAITLLRERRRTTGQECLTIGSEGDSNDRVLVCKASALFARGDIPQSCLFIDAACHHQFAVGAKRHGTYFPFVRQRSTMVISWGSFPEPGRLVGASA